MNGQRKGFSTFPVRFHLEADHSYTIYDSGGCQGCPPSAMRLVGRIERGGGATSLPWALWRGDALVARFNTVAQAKRRYLEDRGLVPPAAGQVPFVLVRVHGAAWHAQHRWRSDVTDALKRNPENRLVDILRLWYPVRRNKQGTILVLRLPVPVYELLAETTTGVVIRLEQGLTTDSGSP